MNNAELPSPPSPSKRFCNNCKVETKHDLLTTHTNENEEYFVDDEGERQRVYIEQFQWFLWSCRGCETPLLERRATLVGYGDEDTTSYAYYPSRTERHFPRKHFTRLPNHISLIYKETCEAYNNSLALLCAGGIRAIIESICRDKNITGKNLQQRIDGLKSILPENLVSNLHSIRFLGNEALHELKMPKIDELHLGLEILTDLMNFMYDLDYKAARLNQKRLLQDLF